MNLYIDGLEEGKYREIRPEERKELEEMLSSGRSQQETGVRKKSILPERLVPGMLLTPACDLICFYDVLLFFLQLLFVLYFVSLKYTCTRL